MTGHICAKCDISATEDIKYANCPRGGMHDFRTPMECRIVRMSMLKVYSKHGPKEDADHYTALLKKNTRAGGHTRGRPPKHTREEIDHMRDLYYNKKEKWTIPDIARFFRTSTATVNKAIEGKLKASDEI
jgi:hypothetical protein